MKGSEIVFRTDFLLWYNFLFLLKKNPRRVAKRSGLEERVARELLSIGDLPQRFASDVFLSFVLEQRDFPFEQKLFPSNKMSSLIKNKISFVDFSYWAGLKQLARINAEMARACFGVPRALVDWTLQASETELFRMAEDTTDNLILRYPNSLLKEMLVVDSTDEALICKKGMVIAQQLAAES